MKIPDFISNLMGKVITRFPLVHSTYVYIMAAGHHPSDLVQNKGLGRRRKFVYAKNYFHLYGCLFESIFLYSGFCNNLVTKQRWKLF